MNCDDAFDALTASAPTDEVALDRHLAICPRCRALRTVLEPAISHLRVESGSERPTFPAVDEPGSLRASDGPFLSVEAVRVAQETAAQLTAAARKSNRGDFGSRAERRGTMVAILRGAALVLFGALSVYWLGPVEREAERHAAPVMIPMTAPVRTCTRSTLRPAKGNQDARAVILSCVACHLNDRRPTAGGLRSSLTWPRLRLGMKPAIWLTSATSRVQQSVA